jgi:hypothetical protein
MFHGRLFPAFPRPFAEHRMIGLLDRKEAEEMLENGGGKKKTAHTAENNAARLFQQMYQEVKKIGMATKINYFFSGKRAEDVKLNTLLDDAAEKEIKEKTDAAVSWLGGFVKRRKYAEYVALQQAVKERIRAELETYVKARIERIDKLSFAAGVSAKLKRMTTKLTINSTDEKLRNALQRTQERIRKKTEKVGGIPAEWKEGIEKERALKQQLLRFGVVPVERIEDYLQQNAERSNALIDAIKANPFIDPDDSEPREPHEQEKALCLRITKQLREGLFFTTAYENYRNFKLTQRSYNELPIKQKLKALAEDAEPVGKRVQMVLGNGTKTDAFIVCKDDQHPEAMILRGPGSVRYVLDTDAGRITYKDGPRYRHEALTDAAFSILS